MAKTLLALVALTAVAAVEHNGIKYGPGLPDGADFEATDAEAKALLQVNAAKLRGEEDIVVVNQADTSIVLNQARAATEAAANAQAQADAAAQAAADAQAQANADAAAVVEARAKLEADMKAFAEAQADVQAAAATKKK